MTRVHRLLADSTHHRWLSVAQSTMKPLGLLLRGQPLRDLWDPPVLEELHDAELPDGPVGDCAHLDAVPAFSEAAIDRLRDLLEPNGELLPTRYAGGTLFVYNVTTTCDALDDARSDLVRSDDGQRILVIRRHEFRAPRLEGATIFRLPGVGNPIPYVTQAVVDRVVASGLTGFRFETVWTGP